jgi:4-hydroxy-3-methylbut-2-enyl diphosphate reductase
MGVPSYLIDDASGFDPAWLEDVETVGITAGASAPEELVQELIKRLGGFGTVVTQSIDGVEETVRFKLPQELLEAAG